MKSARTETEEDELREVEMEVSRMEGEGGVPQPGRPTVEPAPLTSVGIGQKAIERGGIARSA